MISLFMVSQASRLGQPASQKTERVLGIQQYCYLFFQTSFSFFFLLCLLVVGFNSSLPNAKSVEFI